MIKRGIMPQRVGINWDKNPEIQNYLEAFQYLKLLTSLEKSREIVDRLKDQTEVLYRQPLTILRAAGLFHLRATELAMQEKLREINSNVPQRPVLLVNSEKNQKLHIVDGYETVCAVYHHDRSRFIPCIVTSWDSPE